ncbi:hypothetical protein AB0C34_17360 [Nocardia sp. NPDC049220]|uniref:hypothetical protein n=1 Tax=Nocardia sp. NPDC049220 TaxID=3155273 RepID=UPI0033E94867
MPATATTSRIHRMIENLDALINHPRTPDNERAAAKAMRERILKKAGNESVVGRYNRHSQYARTYGEKYDRVPEYCKTSVIAKAVREDIKLAQKIAKQAGKADDLKIVDPIGDAPAEITISVRTSTYSGGSSIDIYLKNIPQEWGWTVDEDQWGYEREMPSPALCALADELKAVMNAYNHNGSDIITDYFDVRFYGHVMSDSGLILA